MFTQSDHSDSGSDSEGALSPIINIGLYRTVPDSRGATLTKQVSPAVVKEEGRRGNEKCCADRVNKFCSQFLINSGGEYDGINRILPQGPSGTYFRRAEYIQDIVDSEAVHCVIMSTFSLEPAALAEEFPMLFGRFCSISHCHFFI